MLYFLLSAKESPVEVSAKFRNFEKRVLIKLKHSIPLIRYASGNVLYEMVVSIEIDFPSISLAEIFCFTLFDKVKLGKFARSTSIL